MQQSSLFWQFSASGHQFIHCFVWLPTDEEEVSSSNISVPHASFINVSTSLPGRMVHTCCVLGVGGRWQDLRGLPLQPTLRKELHGRSVGGKGRSRALHVCICVLGPPFTPPQTLSLREIEKRRQKKGSLQQKQQQPRLEVRPRLDQMRLHTCSGQRGRRGPAIERSGPLFGTN